MGLNETPVADRFTIGIFGKRNAGKSTLINAITNQKIAVTSEYAGTTTDPVYKTMEILPIGPVVLIDTAGLDDEGELGQMRVEKTYEVLRKCNLALLVCDSSEGVTEFETEFALELKKRKIACILVLNKCSGKEFSKTSINVPTVCTDAQSGYGIEKLKKLIIENSHYDDTDLSLVEGIVEKNDIVVLVIPIDNAAPKGRLILPEQQVIRAILDKGAMPIVTRETELEQTLSALKNPPKIVITDSQAFKIVADIIPKDMPLTSFSIIFARQKGDLKKLYAGIEAIKKLKAGDTVLIEEGCTHHRQSDDIGTVKIPRFIKSVCPDVKFEWASGAIFPRDLSKYSLIIHCGACMIARREMCYRIDTALEKGVPITNYGMTLAYFTGVLKRALEPMKEFNK